MVRSVRGWVFNIFYLNADPVICAQQHIDKHVVKMPVELCQMLVTARVMKGDLPKDTKYYTYKMRNHPCSVWVRNDRYGFSYTEELLAALCDEYWYRYGHKKDKRHESGEFYKSLPKTNMQKMFEHRRRRKAVPLAVKEYPKFLCPVETYKNYYIQDKQRIANWTGRPIPNWYVMEKKHV